VDVQHLARVEVHELVLPVGLDAHRDAAVDAGGAVGEAALGRRRPDGTAGEVPGVVAGEAVDRVSLGHAMDAGIIRGWSSAPC
jgi:hypothetical protein